MQVQAGHRTRPPPTTPTGPPRPSGTRSARLHDVPRATEARDPVAFGVPDLRVTRVEVQRVFVQHHLVQISLDAPQDRQRARYAGRLRRSHVGRPDLDGRPELQALAADALELAEALTAELVDRVAPAIHDDCC